MDSMRKLRQIGRSENSVWRVRDFRVSSAARTFANLGNFSTLTVLTLQAYQLGEGASFVAALLIAAALPAVLLAPVAGRIADSADSQSVLVVTALISTAATAALAATGAAWQLLILVLILQVAQTFADPVWTVLTPQIVGEERVGHAVGAIQMLSTFAMIMGPALGGIAVALMGASWSYLLNASLMLAMCVAVLRIRTRQHQVEEDTDETLGLKTSFAGFRSVANDSLLRSLAILLVGFVLGAESLNVIEVFLVRGSYDAGPGLYGLANALTGLGLFVGAAWAASWGTERQRVRGVVVGAIGLAVLLVLIGVSPLLSIAMFAFALSGVANGVLTTAFGTVMILRTAPRLRGRVAAALNGMTRFCAIVGPVIGGALGEAISPRSSFIAVGAAILIVTLAASVPVFAMSRGSSTAGHDSTQAS